ncbi:MAG: hypothetical protein Q8L57_03425, partial [bacterium]|nr:hypothetical protein [bacterium]
ASLLPSTNTTIQSPWQNFDDCKAAFDRIIPGKTTAKELKELGFDPFSNPNIQILTYLDIQQRFLSSPSVFKEDLPAEVEKALGAKDACYGYEVMPQTVKSKRTGNFWLDILRFKRETKEDGWQFKALIILVNNEVVYKLWGGTPNINKSIIDKKPLGPFQEFGDWIINIGKGFIGK